MMLIRHVGIYVHDLEKMQAFYCKHFDMLIHTYTREQGVYISDILNEPEVEVELYKLRRKDGSMIELLRAGKADTREVHSDRVINCGCMHIAFTVDDAGEKYQELKQDGCVMLSCPQVSPDNCAKVFFCRDPEGNYLEIVEEL